MKKQKNPEMTATVSLCRMLTDPSYHHNPLYRIARLLVGWQVSVQRLLLTIVVVPGGITAADAWDSRLESHPVWYSSLPPILSFG